MLNDQGEEVKENCFKFISQEEGEVAWYNDESKMIKCRKLFPSERRTTVLGNSDHLGTPGRNINNQNLKISCKS